MVCRNKERAEEAREAIVNQTGNAVSCFKVGEKKKRWLVKENLDLI